MASTLCRYFDSAVNERYDGAMNQAKTHTSSRGVHDSSVLLRSILSEVRSLRNELALILPAEGLKDYAHPTRIRRSYQKALKRYPLTPAWK